MPKYSSFLQVSTDDDYDLRLPLQTFRHVALKLRANGGNNSQRCVRLGSGVQKGCNNSQQRWDLQCIMGRIQPRRLWRSRVVRVSGPNNVGRAVQLDPTLLRSPRFGDHGAKEMLGVAGLEVWPVWNFAQQLPTTSNNMQQVKQTDTTSNIQQWWELLATNDESVCTGL